MRSLITGLIIALSISYCFAQKAPAKFGDVSIEDLKMTRFANDSSAEAVVLVDFGESSMPYNQQTGFSLLFERLLRIKILTKEGLDWGNFSIPLYREGTSDEKVSGLKAVTYNLENGKIVETKMKNDAVFRETVDQNFELVKLTLPNVREGSVIEITYKVNSDFWFNYQDWTFQYTIPVVWSEYRARMPEYFNYDKYTQGYVPFHINDYTTTPGSIVFNSTSRSDGYVTRTTISNEKIDFREHNYRWVAKDVPAFRAEPFITTSQDYISKINFELAYTKFPNTPIKSYTSTWDDINKTYLEHDHFGKEVTGNGFLKKIAEELTLGKNTPEEKISAICNFVKSSVTWDGRNRKFTDTALRKVLDEKKGSSAEINLLLASMLEKAGITVYPVLISTRDHGFVREAIAISSQFNSVICLAKVGEKSVLLDATEKLLPTGFLPERCLNGSGLVVAKGGYDWVSLASPSKSRTTTACNFTLNEEGLLKGDVQFDHNGYSALSCRKKILSGGEPDYIKNQYGNPSWELLKSQFQNVNEIGETFKEIHELQISDHVTTAGDVMFINPFVHAQLTENPFKSEKREYPVDFGYAFDKIYSFKITLPEGYEVEEFPAPKAYGLPGNAARYSYNSIQTGNVLTITSLLQINKSLFNQMEYGNLREFYNQIVSKQSEQIVIRKK